MAFGMVERRHVLARLHRQYHRSGFASAVACQMAAMQTGGNPASVATPIISGVVVDGTSSYMPQIGANRGLNHNPCVGGSSPSSATNRTAESNWPAMNEPKRPAAPMPHAIPCPSS
jgi:hypothetical protein